MINYVQRYCLVNMLIALVTPFPFEMIKRLLNKNFKQPFPSFI
jgi:hypothetical protein